MSSILKWLAAGFCKNDSVKDLIDAFFSAKKASLKKLWKDNMVEMAVILLNSKANKMSETVSLKIKLSYVALLAVVKICLGSSFSCSTFIGSNKVKVFLLIDHKKSLGFLALDFFFF